MKVRRAFCCVTAILILVLGCSGVVAAQAVGRLTKVEGRVDILKGGNLPATQAKANDPVAAKDVIRTKSLSKAEITFVDNSVVTISPESRLAVEEYSVDTAQGKRQAVLEVFQGLALAVVNKIFKSAEPDFVVKTHTAIMGVRGTEFGIRVQPNASTILNFQGLTQVGNVFPEVAQLFRRAFKVAYAFGPMDDKSSRWVLLKDMQGTTVARNLPPTLPFAVSPEDREMFLHQLAAGLSSGKGSGGDSVAGAPGGSLGSLSGKGGAAGNLLATNVLTDSSSLGLVTGTGNTALTLVNAITVPPTVMPQQQLAQTQPGGTTPAPIAGIAIPVFNILTIWGSGGVDLDLHLTGPMGESTFHVYYSNPGSLTSQPYALLNADNTGRSGSEVITVQQFNQGGPYQASVFNYGDQSTTSTNLSTAAGVSLKVINGGTVVPTPGGGSTVNGGTAVTETLTPTPNLAGNTWVAVSINPANGQVTAVNQITNTTNGVNPIAPATPAAAAAPSLLTTTTAASSPAPTLAAVPAATPAVVPATTSVAAPAPTTPATTPTTTTAR